LKERGNERVFVDIFPIQFDSISGKYFQVNYLEVEFKTSTNRQLGSNLRTGENTGNSVLANGDWYKIPIMETGVYKIDYDFLNNSGINVTGINPKKIKIHGNGGGMLPQQNSEERPVDLVENAILVVGESDGKFDKEDFILFYGEDADYHKLDATGELNYQKNYYSDTSYYFLTISDEEGLRIAERENLGSDQPKIQYFDDFIIYEKDEYNIINSGREWYGEKFDFTLTYDFKFDFTDLIPDTELSVTSAVMGQTYEQASLDLSVNGQHIGQQTINAIVEGSYLAKGSNQIDEFTINSSSIPFSEEFILRLSFNPAGSGKSRANLNYLTVIAKRKLKLFNSQTRFRSLESTQNAISTFDIEGGSAAFQVWDVTEPFSPHNQKFSTNGGDASFGTFSAELREFIIFKDEDYLLPEKAVKILNQNLHAS
ncbi:MAG: hypothetical protein KAQ62_28945, partial [Cyclobacteriaceae bacterium]|nr:hypothetical protein [Cyclobacteriaceae bacterium]